MVAVLIGMCLFNTLQLFLSPSMSKHSLDLHLDDLWLVAPKRQYEAALAARRARPLAALCISNY